MYIYPMSQTQLNKVFDPERFRSLGHQLIDQLSDYLQMSYARQGKVTHFVDPDDELAFWQSYRAPGLLDYTGQLLNRSIKVHHPRYIGHQVSVPVPETALIGLLSNLLNNGMGIYEMGQAPTALERLVTDALCKKVGFDSSSGGFLTSGGTLANLTALLAARAALRKRSSGRCKILVSDQAHYCIERAAITMGLDRSDVIKIRSDHQFQIDLISLKKQLRKCIKTNENILAIVGCACSTATGSYDDLEAMAKICRSHDIWFHVDGAHGGAAVFSDKNRYLVKGLSKADSVVIDAHKMMMVPALATATLFRNQLHAYDSFNQEASYLYEEKEPEWYQLTKRTYETTKYMMSAKIYWLLQNGGDGIIGSYVDRQYNQARIFKQIIDGTHGWEAAHEPMSNIVCFRCVAVNGGEETQNDVNRRIRHNLLQRGNYYITQANLKGKVFLRLCIMNPLTSREDLEGLIQECQGIFYAL